MISRTLGRSKKFASVESERHRLMYCLLLPWVDSEGRLYADPLELGADAFTRMGWSEEEIQAGLDALSHAGLIRCYEVEGEHYLEVVDFLKHNTPHHREGDSKLPPPLERRTGVRKGEGERDDSKHDDDSTKHDDGSANVQPSMAEASRTFGEASRVSPLEVKGSEVEVKEEVEVEGEHQKKNQPPLLKVLKVKIKGS